MLKTLLVLALCWMNAISAYAQTLGLYEAGLIQQVDVFSEVFDTQYMTTLHLSSNKDHGKYTAKVHLAQRFDRSGAQVELEAYPKLAKGIYAYAAYAYSPSIIFPDHRGGLELFAALPYRNEGSLGFRYLHFPAGSSSTLLTGSLSHYWKSYLFSVRPFLIFSAGGRGQTILGSVRYFLNDDGSYMAIRGGGGASPEGILFQLGDGQTGSNLLLLSSRQLGAEAAIRVSQRLKVHGSLDIIRQELAFSPGNTVNNYSLQLGIVMGFR